MINDQNNCCCCNDCNGDLKKPPQCRPRRGRKKEGWHRADKPCSGKSHQGLVSCLRVFIFYLYFLLSLILAVRNKWDGQLIIGSSFLT